MLEKTFYIAKSILRVSLCGAGIIKFPETGKKERIEAFANKIKAQNTEYNLSKSKK